MIIKSSSDFISALFATANVFDKHTITEAIEDKNIMKEPN